MTTRDFLRLTAIVLIVGCGGDPTGSGGDGDFTATIDGVAWVSAAAVTQVAGAAGGLFTIVGSSADASPLVMTLAIANIDQPGSYPLGVGATVRGGLATLTTGSSSWSTPLSGGAGSIELTTVSATRIEGTFSYVATPQFGPTAGNRNVMQGRFNLPVTSTGSIAVPANVGSSFGGQVGGSGWNAATVAVVSVPSSGTLAAGGSNDTYFINMTISDIAGPATYTLNTGVARFMAVMALDGSSRNWGGSNATSNGSVVLTNVSASRVQGTYNATLQPNGGTTGTIQVAGSFDIGLP